MMSVAAAFRLFLLFVALMIGVNEPLRAHDSRPVYVEINEQQNDYFQVRWKVPVSLPLSAQPMVKMPDNCNPAGDPVIAPQGDAVFHQRLFNCDGGLSGRALALVYPGDNPSLSALFRISLANGERHSHVLRPGQRIWTIPEAESFWGVASQYTVMGIQHIFLGIDHLLFVACLVFIAGTLRRILITITGFTLAHSATLILSALDVIRLPSPPVEAAIALSIVFLAHEIAVGRREKSWTWRYPVTVSTSFGLLHGFGFAAVLLDLGLPQIELLPALLFFNVGVEIGQLIFVIALSGVALIFARFLKLHVPALLAHRRVNLAASYGIGCLAAYWLIERMLAF